MDALKSDWPLFINPLCYLYSLTSINSVLTQAKRITFRKPRQTESLELQIGIRFFAFVIDLMVIRILVRQLIDWLIANEWLTWEYNFWEANLVNFFIYWIYFAALEGTLGGTLGKLFVRLRIYNTDGSKLTLGKAIVRFPLKVISALSLIGILLIEINKEKQGLHDLLCGTIVRRNRRSQ